MQARAEPRHTPSAGESGPPPSPHDSARPRPGPPNGWRRGRVLRTLWPPAAGTHRWLRQHGAELVCVRHREDPLGLRRVVTVELVVAAVRTRHAGPLLRPRVRYPLRIAPTDRAMRLRVQAAGGTQNPQTGVWHATGGVIEALGLLDWLLAGKVR